MANLRNFVQSQLANVNASITQMRTKDIKKQRNGKTKMPIEEYKRVSQARIAKLDSLMTQVDQGSSAYRKLRKQQLAQKSRYRLRLLESQHKNKLLQVEQAVDMALALSLSIIPPEKRDSFVERLKAEDPSNAEQYKQVRP